MRRRKLGARCSVTICAARTAAVVGLALAGLAGAPAAALEECNNYTQSSREVVLPAGQDEARCSFVWGEVARTSYGTFGLRFAAEDNEDGGPLEAEVDVRIVGVWTRESPDSEWIEAGGPVFYAGSSVELSVLFDEVPAPGFDHWRYSEQFLVERTVRLGLPQAGWQFPGSVIGWVKADLEFVLTVRRPRSNCWTVGSVRGEQVSGDYAFWSSNPTGVEELPMEPTKKDAQDSLQAIGNLDPEKLAAMGLDLGQVQSAIDTAKGAAAGAAEKAASEAEAVAKKGVLDELAVEGITWVTLQSVKGDDDVELLGGEPAGIAGDLSAIELAQGAAHILSKFSLTLELGADFDGEEVEKLFGKSLPVHRAGLAHRGLKYTYPRDGGPTPVVVIAKCWSGPPAAGAVCGRVSWEGVAEVLFRAGPGAFSCINN